jgi:hypothetical protein
MLSARIAPALGLAALGLALLAPACAGDGTSDESDLVNTEKNGGPSQKWIYLGMLPKLEKPSIFVSLKANTARVTGLLPTSFAGDLPFYAAPEVLSTGRTQVTVVYPVATGKVDPTTGVAPAGPGTYTRLYAVPFTQTTDKAAWGGFPFMTYNPGRGLAFHGPITSVYNAEMGDYEWRLIRGAVSHGCQRMQGEHVVELANLLGIDMAKPHSTGESATIDVKVTVSKEWDSFEGQYIDVDYPVAAGVTRPTTNVAMYPTWDSNDFPRWVCAYDSKRPLDAHHCDHAGEPRRDALTGDLLPTSQKPFVGTACHKDATCAFSASTGPATCLTSNGNGFCTLACEGYCPDQDGASRTFCVDTGDGKGRCMAKTGPENHDCADIPGTHNAMRSRFIGKSTAKAAQASVCSF